MGIQPDFTGNTYNTSRLQTLHAFQCSMWQQTCTKRCASKIGEWHKWKSQDWASCCLMRQYLSLCNWDIIFSFPLVCQKMLICKQQYLNMYWQTCMSCCKSFFVLSQISYMISAWARMCKIMGKDFEQYLPLVMGPVLKAAALKPEVALLDSKFIQFSFLPSLHFHRKISRFCFVDPFKFGECWLLFYVLCTFCMLRKSFILHFVY